MKKSVNSILVIILLMIATTGKANGSLKVHIYEVGESKFKVEVLNIRGKAVSFIKDQNDQILFERKLNKEESTSLIFDLSNIEDGEYTFIVEDQFKRQTVPFTLIEEKVSVHFEQMDRLNFPQLIRDNNKVLVKFLSNDEQNLKLAIRNRLGDTLFQDEIKGVPGLVGKQFQFEPGEYLVTMSCEGFSSTEYLSF
ncbi:MAG: hypothetical protein HRT61_18445 [Ekhidna sp.]|nr:hypothetical protein [Ekhidna sp.]